MDSVSKKKPQISQLEFPIATPLQADRNSIRGGRSFYFFDLDDNVLNLPTPLFVFNKKDGSELSITTREFANISHQLGTSGRWQDFEERFDPDSGSFRRFRQKKIGIVDKLLGKKQPILEDLLSALKQPVDTWRGPSWNFFWHAVHNARPLSIITARGHHPDTMKLGIRQLVKQGHLSREPNYLSLFPVSHFDVRKELGDHDGSWHTAKLKQLAIQKSVREAFRIYGFNPAHRFGMSDDDPTNVKLIVEAMQELKREFPENSFFVIDTQGGQMHKQEVFMDHVKAPEPFGHTQLSLFESQLP